MNESKLLEFHAGWRCLFSFSILVQVIHAEMILTEGNQSHYANYFMPPGVWNEPYAFIDMYGLSFTSILLYLKPTSGANKQLMVIRANWDYDQRSTFRTLSNSTYTELPSEYRQILKRETLTPYWVAMKDGNVMFGEGYALYENIIIDVAEPLIEAGDVYFLVSLQTQVHGDVGHIVYTREQINLAPATTTTLKNLDISKLFDGDLDVAVALVTGSPMDVVITFDVSGSFMERYVHVYNVADTSCDEYTDLLYHADNSRGLGEENQICRLHLKGKLYGKQRCTYKCVCANSVCAYIILRVIPTRNVSISEIQIY